MAVKPTAAPAAEPTTSWENPLIPNKKLRELYTAMVELRLLERHIAKLQRSLRPSARLHLHPGEEGCLVSTVLSLNPGDLTSESAAGIATRFLRGAKLGTLFALKASPAKDVPGEMPAVADTPVRLHLAVGAALALAARKKGSLAVAYVYAGDLTLPQWKPILKLAAAHAAPLLFVILPSESAAKPGGLSLASTACGVPGIPVDAADPVALYRVAQESMLRVRAGGGPVLMECIPFRLPGKPAGHSDPIETMQQFLLPRGIATEDWFQNVSAHFAARLEAAAK
jgi:TPP-dependent pyruvate/acetoin dehydrogenase alpha subunit